MKVLIDTMFFQVVQLGVGFTAIRKKDNKGLPLLGGSVGRNWVDKLQAAEPLQMHRAISDEISTSDDLIDYSQYIKP